MKKTLVILAMCFTAVAAELPPTVPSGRVTYDEVSYQPLRGGDSELPPEFLAGTGMTVGGYDAPVGGVVAPPVTPAQSTSPHTVIDLNAYATNYQVRGMGVTNGLSRYGVSSLAASHTFANRNLFRRGIQHRVHGMVGAIWDAASPLGDIPQFELGYSVGKEVAPNLLVEVGYHFRRGGFEGFMAKNFDNTSHRSAQDVALTVSYNDYQKGVFGHAEWGWGFYGLTGCYFDVELGYRFVDVAPAARIGTDVEISAGVAPSVSYWGSGIEGIDAYRVRLALRPFSREGRLLGRDARTQVKPWVQCSWDGGNARKIDRHTGIGPVDHFQITVGLDVGWKF